MSYYDILMKNVKFWAFPGQGRGGCCSPLVTPDLIRGRLIEPCRSVTLDPGAKR